MEGWRGAGEAACGGAASGAPGQSLPLGEEVSSAASPSLSQGGGRRAGMLGHFSWASCLAARCCKLLAYVMPSVWMLEGLDWTKEPKSQQIAFSQTKSKQLMSIYSR